MLVTIITKLTVVTIVHQSGISIGLPVGGTPEGCMYMLNHSKAQFVFAEDHQQVDKILQVLWAACVVSS